MTSSLEEEKRFKKSLIEEWDPWAAPKDLVFDMDEFWKRFEEFKQREKATKVEEKVIPNKKKYLLHF